MSVSAFRIAATETTNAEYEQFDASHKLLRGKYYFSRDDNDAVRGLRRLSLRLLYVSLLSSGSVGVVQRGNAVLQLAN